MIIKSFSIPSASCVHSVVRPMTADEIRLMNEQLAARRPRFVAQVREWNGDKHEWQTPSIKRQMDDAGLGHSGQF
jgi:hypothetical protein